ERGLVQPDGATEIGLVDPGIVLEQHQQAETPWRQLAHAVGQPPDDPGKILEHRHLRDAQIVAIKAGQRATVDPARRGAAAPRSALSHRCLVRGGLHSASMTHDVMAGQFIWPGKNSAMAGNITSRASRTRSTRMKGITPL